MASRQQQKQAEGKSQPPSKAEAFGVPQPPEIQKQWTFTKVQMIGVPLLILIPVLALLGVFGESFETANQGGETFAVEITYPERFRYKMTNPLVVAIENISSQSVPTVTVAFDQAYISQFSGVSFQPSVSEITDDAYYVQLEDVQPGEVRQVVVEIQAERYWRHEGRIAVIPGGVDGVADATLEVSTLVFP